VLEFIQYNSSYSSSFRCFILETSQLEFPYTEHKHNLRSYMSTDNAYCLCPRVSKISTANSKNTFADCRVGNDPVNYCYPENMKVVISTFSAQHINSRGGVTAIAKIYQTMLLWLHGRTNAPHPSFNRSEITGQYTDATPPLGG